MLLSETYLLLLVNLSISSFKVIHESSLLFWVPAEQELLGLVCSLRAGEEVLKVKGANVAKETPGEDLVVLAPALFVDVLIGVLVAEEDILVISDGRDDAGLNLTPDMLSLVAEVLTHLFSVAAIVHLSIFALDQETCLAHEFRGRDTRGLN